MYEAHCTKRSTAREAQTLKKLVLVALPFSLFNMCLAPVPTACHLGLPIAYVAQNCLVGRVGARG